MLLRREFGPASCRVFNRYPAGESAKTSGVLLFPGKKWLLNSGCWPLNRLAQLQASLHSQQPVPSPWFSRAGSAADGSVAASASSKSTQLVRPTTAAVVHTREGFLPWAATQPASKALHRAGAGAGKLPGLKWCGFNEIFLYDLCSKLPVLSIVLE